MKLDYLSVPVPVKAILYDGQNYEQVLDVIRLNGGQGNTCFADQNYNPVPEGTITEFKVIMFTGANPNQEPAVAPPGFFILLNGEQGTMYPIPEELFKQYHVENASEISNGQHSFKDLYKQLSRYEPTLEEVIVADKFHLFKEDKSVQLFIKQSAIQLMDSSHKSYYVINGMVYVD